MRARTVARDTPMKGMRRRRCRAISRVLDTKNPADYLTKMVPLTKYKESVAFARGTKGKMAALARAEANDGYTLVGTKT